MTKQLFANPLLKEGEKQEEEKAPGVPEHSRKDNYFIARVISPVDADDKR